MFKKQVMSYEEIPDKNKQRKLFRKGELKMDSKVKAPVKHKVTKTKNTLTVFTYLNLKRFGLSIAIDDGIKVNIAWFETHIKFAKI